MILEALAVGPFASNCFIVGSENTKEGLIIDPGEEADTILKKVEELGLTVKLIVLTHGHIDHVMALKAVKDATGAEFAMHEGDVKILEQRMLAASFGISLAPPPPPDRLLKGGDTIEVGDVRFLVLHTPGHSPGGICLLGHGIVISGDTLFNLGIGRTDFPGSSFAQLMNSIHTKLMVLPAETVVYPGHGPETTIGYERQWNPFVRGDFR